ncbi:MAG: InlB B-repeat-containing protein [Kiritimatiellae bacterium]|nr:InlB B-repeat-containing protein [Kiritimatiellia bacterium]
MFCQYLGGNLTTPSAEQLTSYAAFLSTNNVDFGFFYGPTGAENFGLTAEGYTATTEYVSNMAKGGRVLVYKTAAWRVASHDSPQNTGTDTDPVWCERYVLERLSNGEQFAVVLFTGTRFDTGSSLAYEDYLSNTPALYPGAWVLVALPCNGALCTSSIDSSIVASNLSGDYTRVPNVDGTGAVFSKNHATLSTSGASVPQETLGFGDEPAALATVTYQRSLTVTFNDYDGSTIDTATVLEGNDASPPADPTRTGYHFTGWSGSYQNVQTDLTLAAQYEINTYTVTFQDWYGTVLKTETVNHGSNATPPANPAPPDDTSVFYKWQGRYTSVTDDVDVLAIFIPKVIEVGTGAEFVEYLESDLMGMSAITIALTNDISLSGISHSGGQLFAAIDGRGHTVSNIPSSFKMFSEICGGMVRDICFKGFRSPGNANRTAIIASASYVGSTLSGVTMEDCRWTVPSGSYGTSAMIYNVSESTLMTNCVMRNCAVLGASAGGGGQYIGGFVAIASDLRMVDCHFIVDDTNTVAIGDGIHVAGAFIGKCGSDVTIEQCSNNARVKVAKNAGEEGGAGGFIGIATSSGSTTIRDCANFGVVQSTVPTYPAGGQTGILFGGRDIMAENELTIDMGDGKVLESNSAIALYYDRLNAAVAWDSPITFGAKALTGYEARRALDLYANEHNHTTWVGGRNFPELKLFGTECLTGISIKFR